MQKSTPDFTNWLLLGLLTIIWGSSYILIKKALIAYTPIEVGLLRLSLSFIASSPFLFKAFRQIETRLYGRILVVGLLGTGIPVFLFAFSTTKINSSINGIINSLSPLFTVITGIFFFGTQITRIKWLGVLMGFMGAAVLVVGRYGFDLGLSAYALLSVLATLCYGTNSNFVKHYFPKVSALQVTALAMFFMGFPALVLAMASGLPAKVMSAPQALYSFSGILFLAVFGTVVAWLIFYKLVQRTDALFAASVTYLIPLVAILLGLLDGETFKPIQSIGVILILAGVYFVGKKVKVSS
jgi:drug/metabolite transporter (DMT)-like permease